MCGDIPVLKLSLTYPLPTKLIRDFVNRFKKTYVVEELDPFIEEEIKGYGINVTGKERFPSVGELTPDIVHEGLFGKKVRGKRPILIFLRESLLCVQGVHILGYSTF